MISQPLADSMVFLKKFQFWLPFRENGLGLGFDGLGLLRGLGLRIQVEKFRVNWGTYASEPQRRVRDFCVSLSDLSELRQALNFPSQAGNL